MTREVCLEVLPVMSNNRLVFSFRVNLSRETRNQHSSAKGISSEKHRGAVAFVDFQEHSIHNSNKKQNVSTFTHVMPNSSHLTSKSLQGILEKQVTASEHCHISDKTPLQRNVGLKTTHSRPAKGVVFVELDEWSKVDHPSVLGV